QGPGIRREVGARGRGPRAGGELNGLNRFDGAAAAGDREGQHTAGGVAFRHRRVGYREGGRGLVVADRRGGAARQDAAAGRRGEGRGEVLRALEHGVVGGRDRDRRAGHPRGEGERGIRGGEVGGSRGGRSRRMRRALDGAEYHGLRGPRIEV